MKSTSYLLDIKLPQLYSNLLEDPKFSYINLKCHTTSLEANIRTNEVVFMEKHLKKRTELLTVDVIKENNMAASLSILSNTGYIDFNF